MKMYIPERIAKKAKRKQYRKAKKTRGPVQKMHKQIIRVPESQNKEKREGEKKENRSQSKDQQSKRLYTSRKQFKKLPEKGAIFLNFSKNMIS